MRMEEEKYLELVLQTVRRKLEEVQKKLGDKREYGEYE